MEWEFSPEDVVKGHAAYGLIDFRRDLAQEVRANLPQADEARQARGFNLIYDMCYALATNRSFEEFLSAHAYDPPTCEFLSGLKPFMDGNVAMLGAILQRLIMERVEAHMPLEQAVQDAAQWHADIVADSGMPRLE